MQNATDLPEPSSAVAELLASIDEKLLGLRQDGGSPDLVAELQRLVDEIRSALEED